MITFVLCLRDDTEDGPSEESESRSQREINKQQVKQLKTKTKLDYGK